MVVDRIVPSMIYFYSRYTRGLLLFLSLLEVELADVTCSEDLHQVGSWRQSREKKPIAVIIIIIMVCGKGLVDYLQINLDTPFSLPLHCLIPLHNSSPQCTLGNFLNPKGAQNYWNNYLEFVNEKSALLFWMKIIYLELSLKCFMTAIEISFKNLDNFWKIGI